MKIILSRKGFDSSYGGVASPILPDGRLISLPIPYKDPIRKYKDISSKGESVSEIVSSLTQGKISPTCSCHLDPDLHYDSVPRTPGWRPTLGQVGAAQSHLKKQNVSVGDLFLFFGWFKETEWNGKALVFKRKARDLHVIFGWLQIGEMHRPSAKLLQRYSWLKEHPHCQSELDWNKNNTIYIAKEKLELPDCRHPLPGGGTFDRFRPSLQLTSKSASKRSLWGLPQWFYPEGKESVLSYHKNLKRWSPEESTTTLQSVGKGQEFVLNTEHYPEAIDWARELIMTSN